MEDTPRTPAYNHLDLTPPWRSLPCQALRKPSASPSIHPLPFHHGTRSQGDKSLSLTLSIHAYLQLPPLGYFPWLSWACSPQMVPGSGEVIGLPPPCPMGHPRSQNQGNWVDDIGGSSSALEVPPCFPPKQPLHLHGDIPFTFSGSCKVMEVIHGYQRASWKIRSCDIFSTNQHIRNSWPP